MVRELTDADGAGSLTAPYLRRLERLATTVLRADFRRRPESLWTVQLDLLKVQRDIQNEIAAAKQRAKRDRSLRGDVIAMREVRWHARHLGDAYAWLLLGLDRKLIYPLAFNDPVPIPPDGHGSTGVVAAAEGLAGRGWGFPLLHDITNILRIGDITFIKPDGDPAHRTVEIKTRVNGRRPTGDGRLSMEYAITVLFATGEPSPELGEPGSRQRPREAGAKELRVGKVARQLERLDKARARQQLQPGKVTDVAGEPVLTVRAEVDRAGNQDVLRRVARRARRTGYASEAVEGAFLYAAIYNPNRVHPAEDEQSFRNLARDLAGSGILSSDKPERNALVVSSVPHPEDGVQLYLPYYLYPLPRATIIDMLHGRMALFNLVNPGRFADALEHRGFEVSVADEGHPLRNGALTASFTFEDEVGETYAAQLQNFALPLNEMIMEFKSIEYLVATAEAMRDGARTASLDERRAGPHV